jgi:hypothetical protein
MSWKALLGLVSGPFRPKVVVPALPARMVEKGMTAPARLAAG